MISDQDTDLVHTFEVWVDINCMMLPDLLSHVIESERLNCILLMDQKSG